MILTIKDLWKYAQKNGFENMSVHEVYERALFETEIGKNTKRISRMDPSNGLYNREEFDELPGQTSFDDFLLDDRE